MASSIQDKMVCGVCGACLRRCPCCGKPFCDAHHDTRELCADCETHISDGVGRLKRAVVLLTVVCAAAGAIYAALIDGTWIAGLAGIAICVPVVTLLAELCGRLARPYLLARRRRAQAGCNDVSADALPEPSSARGD